ncbi:response regulator, partial [bacterium]|nr:response regulator [bacterium]
MNPKTYKKEFSIFVYDENPVQARYLKEILSRAGYEVHFYTSEELFLQAIYLTLPHIILLPCLEKTADLAKEIKKISREIQIFATGAQSDGERLHRLLEQKLVYDYILEPVTFSAQLIHRIERGVEAWLVTMFEENK